MPLVSGLVRDAEVMRGAMPVTGRGMYCMYDCTCHGGSRGLADATTGAKEEDITSVEKEISEEVRNRHGSRGGK